MPIGVLTNCASVLAGGVIGSALGHILPASLKEHLPTMFGLCSIAIGINSIIKASAMTPVVLALLVGFTIGHLLHLEQWTSRFFHKLVKAMHLGGDGIDMEFYITAVALFCCSGFGWYSTLTEGIRRCCSPRQSSTASRRSSLPRRSENPSAPFRCRSASSCCACSAQDGCWPAC